MTDTLKNLRADVYRACTDGGELMATPEEVAELFAAFDAAVRERDEARAELAALKEQAEDERREPDGDSSWLGDAT